MRPGRYILPPLAVAFIAWYGGTITAAGMEWYRTLTLPTWTPDGSVISMAWTAIFVLVAFGIVLYLHAVDERFSSYAVILLLVVNGLLNIGWSWLFFDQHLVGAAVLDAALLGLSAVVIMFAMWPASKVAALMFAPYAGWVAFATYLNYVIWTLN